MADAFYVCKTEPKADEIRTLHVDKTGNACDHTNYGAHSQYNRHDLNYLDLYHNVGQNVARLHVQFEDNKHRLHDAYGSGFVTHAADGKPVIVTADHVIATKAHQTLHSITAGLPNGENYSMRIRADRPVTDTAVLAFKHPDNNLPEGVRLSPYVDQKQPVVGMGYAEASRNIFLSPATILDMTTVGQLTGGKRIKDSRMPTSAMMLEMEGHVEPGDSGGPLFNRTGDVYGLVTVKGGLHFAYAIPSSDILPVLELADRTPEAAPSHPHHEAPHAVAPPHKTVAPHVPLPPHKPHFK